MEVGLLDATGYLDASEVANDEAVQFLGSSFVNNPAIEFPHYTVGALYHREDGGRRPGSIVALTSSNCLGDNPNASYSDFFDVGASETGVFAVAEVI